MCVFVCMYCFLCEWDRVRSYSIGFCVRILILKTQHFKWSQCNSNGASSVSKWKKYATQKITAHKRRKLTEYIPISFINGSVQRKRKMKKEDGVFCVCVCVIFLSLCYLSYGIYTQGNKKHFNDDGHRESSTNIYNSTKHI